MRFEISDINKAGSGVLSEYYILHTIYILPALNFRDQALTIPIPGALSKYYILSILYTIPKNRRIVCMIYLYYIILTSQGQHS